MGAIPDPDWQALTQGFKTWIANGETDVYRKAREQFDRLVILGAMQHAGGNRSRAGNILGLSQVTLRAKLRSMGVADAKAVNPDEPDGSRADDITLR